MVGIENCDLIVSGSTDGSFDTATQRYTPVSGDSGLSITDIPAPALGCPQTSCVSLAWQEVDTIAVGGSWTNAGPVLGLTYP